MTEPMRVSSKAPETTKKKSQESGIGETIKVIIEALIIAVVVRTFLFQPFNIPSGSLIPTLLVGDYLFISKYSYGYSKFSFPFSPNLFTGRIFETPPKRGDVAVFKLPRDGETDYIKRVIGLPGDKVQMKNGRLFINDQMVDRQPVTPEIVTEDAFGRNVPVPTYRETLPGGVSHLIIERDGDTGYYDNTDVYEVPQGDYFMMGDNRDNSTDSRVPPDQGGVGFVPVENFEGRAEVIFFSIDDSDYPAWEFWHWPWTVRWNRIFQPVR